MEVSVKTKAGANIKKNIFDAAIKKLVMEAVQEGKVIQTQDTDNVEEFVVLGPNGKEVAKLRESYDRGRSTIMFNGEIFTKVDRRYVDGTINKSLTNAESAENLNTINEKDFSEIYGIIAAKAASR